MIQGESPKLNKVIQGKALTTTSTNFSASNPFFSSTLRRQHPTRQQHRYSLLHATNLAQRVLGRERNSSRRRFRTGGTRRRGALRGSSSSMSSATSNQREGKRVFLCMRAIDRNKQHSREEGAFITMVTRKTARREGGAKRRKYHFPKETAGMFHAAIQT